MNHIPDITRRNAIIGGGSLVIAFSLSGISPDAQPSRRGFGGLRQAPNIDSWIEINRDGNVRIFTGKVELGQGIKTALAQIAADELDVNLDRVNVVTADTHLTPDETYTAGSSSIQQSGAALRHTAAEARQILLELAAQENGSDVQSLRVADGQIYGPAGTIATYWDLITERTLIRPHTEGVQTKSPSDFNYVGHPIPRLDIPAKVFGEASFLQDVRLPGMLHGRIVRPPSYEASLISADIAGVRALAGVIDVVRNGSFLGIIAQREEQAILASEALKASAVWNSETQLPKEESLVGYLKGFPTESQTVVEQSSDQTTNGSALQHEAEYFKPYQAHASLAPSIAIAHFTEDTLTIWTHSQGVFPLRRTIAKAISMAEESIRIIHKENAGCFGHNGADDAAFDAVLLAQAVKGRPVRVQWMRDDEFKWEPYGSAMLVNIKAGLDESGQIIDWVHETRGHATGSRPNGNPGSLLAARYISEPFDVPLLGSVPFFAGGGLDRNAGPYYDIPNQRVLKHANRDASIRVSSLRGLGAFGNIFGIESFVDELALATKQDPIAFRLRHLQDERARAVLEAVANDAQWTTDETSETNKGRGVAFARYKNTASYLAIIVIVQVDQSSGQVHVEQAYAAVDAGQVINPDGLRNQIEGGIVQSISWALHEKVTFNDHEITSRDWASYPILTFSEVPDVSVRILDRPQEKTLGAGEAAQGPTVAALANAVFDAAKVRLRQIPFEPHLVKSAMEKED